MRSHLSKRLADLHRERRALLALRDQAPPEQVWMYDDELRDLQRRLKPTARDAAYNRILAGLGGSPPHNTAAPWAEHRRHARRPRRRTRATRAGPDDVSDSDGPGEAGHQQQRAPELLGGAS